MYILYKTNIILKPYLDMDLISVKSITRCDFINPCRTTVAAARASRRDPTNARKLFDQFNYRYPLRRRLSNNGYGVYTYSSLTSEQRAKHILTEWNPRHILEFPLIKYDTLLYYHIVMYTDIVQIVFLFFF